MRGIGRYLLAATVTVFGEIAVGVIGNSVRLPRQFYLVPVVATVALVLVTALVSYRAEARQDPVARATPAGPPGTADLESFIGWSDSLNGRGVLLFVLFLTVWMFCLAAWERLVGYSWHDAFRKTHTTPRNLPTAEALFGVAGGALVIILLLLPGLRLKVVLSDRGVTVRRGRQWDTIGWNEATDFRVVQIYGGGVLFGANQDWLVATPTSDTRYPSTPWGMDRRKRLIPICNLSKAG